MQSTTHNTRRTPAHSIFGCIAAVCPVTAAGLILVASAVAQTPTPAPPAQGDTFRTQIQPLLKKFCIGCHGGKMPAASIDLNQPNSTDDLLRSQSAFRKVAQQLRERTMPPAGSPQPTETERVQTADSVAILLDKSAESQPAVRPGRILIHRLNRQEYNNTLRDLLGDTSNPADSFPADGSGGAGFDNNADTLFIPPILMERYLGAAQSALARVPADRIAPVLPHANITILRAAAIDLRQFASLAYRRPATSVEVARLMSLFIKAAHAGQSFGQSLRFAQQAVLISPNFLFRVERELNSSTPYRISDYELASRLSYFLWSTMPDEPLISLARRNLLHNPATFSAQVRRMLADNRSRAFAESFTGQWLRVRDLFTTAQPDHNQFEEYTPALRDAMVAEPAELFRSLLVSNGSLLDLLDCRYTYLNQVLAQQYGVQGVTGSAMRRVVLPDNTRGGVLTMAGVLTATSYPERTSPVLRGKWVLEQILGARIPPPPPNAGGLPASDAKANGLTFRQRLEQHRSRPECASCHSRMDPIGFGLENYDAIGRWRTQVGGAPVDSTGLLPDGQKFTGSVELKRIIMKRKLEFIHNLVEKMLAYALGRGLHSYDQPTVHTICNSLQAGGYRAEELIVRVALSLPFQYKQSADAVRPNRLVGRAI